jgi:hypothetical protein
MAMSFPLRIAFAVSHRFWQVMFSFSLTSRNFLISSYFINDPLIIEQCVVQLPVVCMFSAVVFVAEF